MKRFLIRFVIFAIIVYGFAWGLDFVISKGLLKMEDYRFMSWNEMMHGEIDADVIIMGNSRGFSHFEPWTIDSVCGTRTYCLGLGGYAITVETLKYYCYQLYNKKPKYIIQNVDYFTMRNDFAPHNHESEQFLPLIYDRRMHQQLLNVGYSKLDVYLPLYRYFGYQMVIKNGLLECFGAKHYVNNPSRKGHHYEKGLWNGRELDAMEKIDATMDSSAIKHFEEYMNNCYDEGIKIILVNSPIYAGATKKTQGLDLVNSYFDSIARKYNTVYLNYTENYQICEDTANFCVSVHMNPEATHRFSIDFANEFKKIIACDSLSEQ